MSEWTKVEWSFSPTAETEMWSGWVERSRVIAPDIVNEYGRTVVDWKKAVIAGDTYAEGEDFLRIQLAFLQPFPEDTILLTSANKDYEDRTNRDAPPPFPRIDDMSKFGIRSSVNFWKLLANPSESRDKDVGGIVQQIANLNDKSDIQTLNFVGHDGAGSTDKYLKQDSALAPIFPDISCLYIKILVALYGIM